MLPHWPHEARATVSNLMRGVLGAFAALAFAAALSGCQSASTAADLSVGDCFTRTPTTDSNGDNVNANTIVECAQPHDAEVFLVFDVPAGPNGYPGDEAIGALQQTRCEAAFAGYVGKEYGLSSYTINYVRPDIDTWGSGDHKIACLIEDASAGKLTGSAKNTKK
jgi:hypothetical protein